MNRCALDSAVVVADVSTTCACGAEHHAFHLVDNIAPAAAPVLLALLVRVTSGAEARRVLAAAAVLADPALCTATMPTLTGPAAKSLAAVLK